VVFSHRQAGRSVQIAFLVILVVALLAAVVSFLTMGVRDAARSRAMGRQCARRGLRFDRDDPYDIPLRYGDFALLAGGHSPRATNVAHGQTPYGALRAFDFRYEVGHGARRATRCYSVVVVDSPQPRPRALLWNGDDLEQGPLALAHPDGQTGRWVHQGGGELAGRIAQAACPLDEQGLSVQTRGTRMMLFWPTRGRRTKQYTAWLDSIEQLLAVLQDDPAPPNGNHGGPPNNPVETDRRA
jgi:hypothetical protein